MASWTSRSCRCASSSWAAATSRSSSRRWRAAARLAALLIPLAEDFRLWGAGQQCFELGPIKRLALHEDLADAVEEVTCLLYTSDAADDLLCVDLGGRRII